MMLIEICNVFYVKQERFRSVSCQNKAVFLVSISNYSAVVQKFIVLLFSYCVSF